MTATKPSIGRPVAVTAGQPCRAWPPTEELDRREGRRLAVEHEDAAQSVRVVGVGREVAARRAPGSGAHALHVPDLREVLRIGHVLRQGAAGLVDVGIDLVRRERRRVNRQATADVATDLAHPDLLAMVAHRTQPEPQVVALVDVVARLLQGEVLRAAEQVEIADRRVGVALAGERGGHHLHDRSRPLLLGRAPAAPRKRREGIVETAHDHQVERVAVLRAVLVGHAARQRLERRSKRGVIGVVHDLPGRIDLAPEHFAHAVIGAEAGHEGEDREGSCPPVGDQVDLHELETFVEVGQDESRARGAGRNGIAERKLAKAPVEFGALSRRLRPRRTTRTLRRREKSSDPVRATTGSRRCSRGSRLRSRPAGSIGLPAGHRTRWRSRRPTAPRSRPARHRRCVSRRGSCSRERLAGRWRRAAGQSNDERNGSNAQDLTGAAAHRAASCAGHDSAASGSGGTPGTAASGGSTCGGASGADSTQPMKIL